MNRQIIQMVVERCDTLESVIRTTIPLLTKHEDIRESVKSLLIDNVEDIKKLITIEDN